MVFVVLVISDPQVLPIVTQRIATCLYMGMIILWLRNIGLTSVKFALRACGLSSNEPLNLLSWVGGLLSLVLMVIFDGRKGGVQRRRARRVCRWKGKFNKTLCIIHDAENNVPFQSFTSNIALTMLNLHRCLEGSSGNLRY